MGWACGTYGEKGYAHRIWVWKPEEFRPRGRLSLSKKDKRLPSSCPPATPLVR